MPRSQAGARWLGPEPHARHALEITIAAKTAAREGTTAPLETTFRVVKQDEELRKEPHSDKCVEVGGAPPPLAHLVAGVGWARMSDAYSARFPPGFLWGVSSASYQLEGAVAEDGRGESIWDRFCATPGKVRNGESGAVACDFYHRYGEDIELMKDLGVDAFRFSISWPRVLPAGRGRLDGAGSTSTTGWSTGSWTPGSSRSLFSTTGTSRRRLKETKGVGPGRATVEAFAEYTKVVAEHLGDRVYSWITHIEPWVVSWLGYGWGEPRPRALLGG